MKVKNIQNVIVVALNVVIWLYVITAPLSYRFGNSHISWEHYLRGLIFPLTDCAIFYYSFYRLVPQYFNHGKPFKLIFHSLASAVVLVLVRELFFPLLFPFPPEVTMRPRPDDITPTWMLYVRSSFTLMLVGIAACGIRMGLQWLETEQTRQITALQDRANELKQLKSQLNPHFLLNTLNNIYALITFDSERAGRAVKKLSSLLRYLLYEVPEREVDIRNEMQFIEDYIQLMQLRLSPDVEVTTDIELPAADRKVFIAPYLFVPIVENAFKHGVAPMAKSYIHIVVRCTENNLYFCCRNSNFPKGRTDRQPGGIGLEQVHRRLELSYAGNYTYQAGVSADGKEYSAEIQMKIRK